MDALGLMDFAKHPLGDNARYYAPRLGRFVSADSIVPGAGNPLAWDRYAYVDGNPLRYTDPSGHGACDGPHQVPECGSVANTSGNVTVPTPLDNLSTEDGGKTGISAADAYNYYLDLWNQKDGWWWTAFGSDSDGFTIWDFLSMMAYHEAGFDTSFVTTMAEAGVRFFYEWTQTLGKSPTVENLLDWWARFSESTARLVKSNGQPQLWSSTEDIRQFGEFGKSFHRPPPSWQQGWADDRPFNWGNASVLSVDTKEMYEANQHAMFVTIPGKNPFYIPSGCAWFNWQSKGNYGLSCPSVP
jgi:RHS repeat-associated protein